MTMAVPTGVGDQFVSGALAIGPLRSALSSKSPLTIAPFDVSTQIKNMQKSMKK